MPSQPSSRNHAGREPGRKARQGIPGQAPEGGAGSGPAPQIASCPGRGGSQRLSGVSGHLVSRRLWVACIPTHLEGRPVRRCPWLASRRPAPSPRLAHFNRPQRPSCISGSLQLHLLFCQVLRRHEDARPVHSSCRKAPCLSVSPATVGPQQTRHPHLSGVPTCASSSSLCLPPPHPAMQLYLLNTHHAHTRYTCSYTHT